MTNIYPEIINNKLKFGNIILKIIINPNVIAHYVALSYKPFFPRKLYKTFKLVNFAALEHYTFDILVKIANLERFMLTTLVIEIICCSLILI